LVAGLEAMTLEIQDKVLLQDLIVTMPQVGVVVVGLLAITKVAQDHQVHLVAVVVITTVYLVAVVFLH
jgi:hypothetical protein